MAFIYETGQELRKSHNKKKVIPRENYESIRHIKVENVENEKDCLIGLCLIKKGVKYVNPDVFDRYYK